MMKLVKRLLLDHKRASVNYLHKRARSKRIFMYRFRQKKKKSSATSLTNHWQKAGPIHSLAWTPQSIQTAFFCARLLFPSWQQISVVRLGFILNRPRASLPEGRIGVVLRMTSRWRTCWAGRSALCSSQTSTSESRWWKQTCIIYLKLVYFTQYGFIMHPRDGTGIKFIRNTENLNCKHGSNLVTIALV